jgi:hypothetical protein
MTKFNCDGCGKSLTVRDLVAVGSSKFYCSCCLTDLVFNPSEELTKDGVQTVMFPKIKPAEKVVEADRQGSLF